MTSIVKEMYDECWCGHGSCYLFSIYKVTLLYLIQHLYGDTAVSESMYAMLHRSTVA